MTCADAIFLLGCERNSDIVLGSAYGALIKHYDEESNTVAAIKHTTNEVLKIMSYYVQKLFAHNMGSETHPVTAFDGQVGPVYSSTTTARHITILKLVDYNSKTGQDNAVRVTVEDPRASRATVTLLFATSEASVNNLPELGGEARKVTKPLSESNDRFSVVFTKAYEVVVVEVPN
ncbi:Glycoside hydrolase superfamily [Fusarium albosuccineum]|uniref:Glycoside hydrolase superfamily n=1 Tax=Fusarium albosuccineum TaxID=1237068 RepID=A0A8H4KZH5_9HYPO|nr:Glycoside hydrolase superfamily [Fusarium albosuccineum]